MTSVVFVTPSAADRICEILNANPGQWLKVGVNNKGCSGHSYTFDLISAHCYKVILQRKQAN